MHHRLPTALAVATILLGAAVSIAPAAAGTRHRAPRRRDSHITLHLSRHATLSGRAVSAHGRVLPAAAGRRVKVVFRGHSGAVETARTDARGRFRLRWVPGDTGVHGVRAYVAHARRARGAASPARHLTVYRRAVASYYGPGLYGHGVACGGTLWPGTLGVANKTLPCGTMVKLRYHGRSVTVPVIDRGPYVAGRDYDLTEATRKALGFPGLGVVLSSR